MKHDGESAQSGVLFAPVHGAPARRTGKAPGLNFLSLALCLLTFGSPAEAAPTFTACVVGPDDSLPGCVSGPAPITMRTGSQTRSIGGSFFSGSGFSYLDTAAESTPLGLRASADVWLFATGSSGQASGGGSGYAAVLYDDFLVSASGVDFVPGSLNLLVSGGLSQNVSATSSGGLIADGYAGAGVTVGMTVNGTYFEGGAFQGKSPSGVDYSTYGPLTDLALPGPFTITSPLLNFPVGTPFSLLLELNPFSSAAAIIRGTADDEHSSAHFDLTALADFTSTLTFPTIGAVFNLPDGATVNAPSALIVNNRFVGAGPETPTVPEPSSIFLLGLGLVALGRQAWKRRLRCSE